MIDLHNHTDYSLLDGKQTYKDLIKYALDNGKNAIALTNHGNMIDTLKFYKECKSKGIKPLIGCEFYYVGIDEQDRSHLILFAKDEKGYKNLLKLQHVSNMKNFYYKPRITWNDLEAYHEGLVCTSACIGSHFAKLERADKKIELLNEIGKFQKLFGDDFYLELQPHEIDGQVRWNKYVDSIYCPITNNIKVVVASDSHYTYKDEKEIHDTVICIGYKQKKKDPERKGYPVEAYIRSEEEMKESLSYLNKELVESAIKNTEEIANKCNVEIEMNMNLLPKFCESPKKTLSTLVTKMFKEKRDKGVYNGLDINVVLERLKYELKVICDKGYADYFLITYDLLEYCRSNDIPVGLGRGSVAGSEVAYVLNIHRLEPIRYGLYFERFLNPTRNSHPDIDNDLCYERRGEAIKYIKDKYGEDMVATVIAVGKLTTSNVVRKVMTAYDFATDVVNTVSTKYIPKTLGITLQEAYDKSKDLREFLDKHQDVKRDCFALENNVSHWSKHAAGIVITPEPVYNYLPVTRDSDDVTMMKSQWDKKEVEEVGAYKFDLLGLKLLTTLGATVKNINAISNSNITLDDLYEMDVEHPSIYKQLNSGELCGVFQFSEFAGKKTIMDAKPKCFADVMACESIARPGVKEAEMYIKNKNEGYELTGFDVLDNILKETYGTIVYQEQTMLILHEIGGYTLGEADAMRKVKSLEPYKEKFVEYAVSVHNITRKMAIKIFDRLDLGYSFNKSHAGVYGKESCITAYLLYEHFTAYMSAYMSMEMLKQDDKSQIKECIQTCKNRGIKFVEPNINTSTDKFIPLDENTIMLPLTFIKGLGDKAIETIIANRPYSNVLDLTQRVPKRNVNSTTLKKLIKAGAFDVFCTDRQALLERYCKQTKMYWCDELKMNYEREVLGMNLGKHPLDGYINVDIDDLPKDTEICINAIITDVNKRIDKNGKEYCFIKCENTKCVFESIIFSYVYPRYSSILLPGMKVNIQGKNDNCKILVNKLTNI